MTNHFVFFLFTLFFASAESFSMFPSIKPFVFSCCPNAIDRIFDVSSATRSYCANLRLVHRHVAHVHSRQPRLIRHQKIVSLAATTMSSESNSAESNIISDQHESIHVLALHGSEGSGQEFLSRLQPLQNVMPHLQMHSFDAPFVKGKGFSWWTLPPGERSFSADTYPGFDASLRLVTEQMNQIQPQLVLAHSQGAIFTAALLVLQHTTTTTLAERQTLPQQHPSLGYILNGLAWPNPFASQLLQLVQEKRETNSATTASTVESLLKPRILVIIGQADSINPPSSAERVVEHLQQAGFPITTLYHNGGHSVPFQNDTSVAAVAHWIQQGLSSSET